MEEKQEGVESEQSEQTEKPEKRVRLRSLRSQIQATLDTLESISNDPKQKPNCRSDAAIKRAELLLDLSRLDHKKEVDAALAENATFHEQLDAKETHITSLEVEVAQLRANQNPVETKFIPDPNAVTNMAELRANGALLTAIAESVRESLSDPERVSLGAKIVTRLGRAAGEFVQRFTDFSGLLFASQKRDDELQETISLAMPGSRGPAVIIARAILAARGVPVVGPQAANSVAYKNEFL